MAVDGEVVVAWVIGIFELGAGGYPHPSGNVTPGGGGWRCAYPPYVLREPKSILSAKLTLQVVDAYEPAMSRAKLSLV